MRRRYHHTIPVALAVLAIMVFAGALQNGFTNWDDNIYVERNVLITRLDADTMRQLFKTPFVNNWAPLTMFSYAADYALWGPEPFGYHLMNVLLHALCTVLLYAFMRVVLARGASDHSRVPATVAALLFAIHPVQIESVAWVSERKNVLSMAFFLGAFLAWTRATGASLRLGCYFGCVALFAASVLSKTHAVILPPLLLLYEWLERPGGRHEGASMKMRLLLLLPLFGIALGMGWVTLQTQEVAHQVRLTRDIFGAIATAPVLVLEYVKDLVFPLNRSAILPRTIYYSLLEPLPLVACLLLAGWVLGVLILHRSRPHVAFFSLWFLVALVPVVNFVPLPVIAADRYQYWAAPGLFALVGLAVYAFWSSLDVARKGLGLGLGIAIAGLLATLTVEHVPVWKDSLTLWTDTVRKVPDAQLGRKKLGSAYAIEGRNKEAIEQYRIARQLGPFDADTHNDLGAVLAGLEDFDAAAVHYAEALRIEPDHGPTHYNLAEILARMGKLEEAIEHYGEVIRIAPAFAPAHYNLGIILSQDGRLDDAIDCYREALRLDAGLYQAHYNLGNLHARREEFREALTQFEATLQLKPDHADARLRKERVEEILGLGANGGNSQ